MKPDLKVLNPGDAPKPPQDEKQSGAQAEMPFAVVDGEPVTQLPQDLYIPPYALQVFLEAFEGPLDLLLYLIRRQNIDILDIPIAEITKQYVQYIELMRPRRKRKRTRAPSSFVACRSTSDIRRRLKISSSCQG